MRVGILTHYSVVNQGAVLQMISMKRWLEDRGHSVYILKYTKDFDFSPDEARKYNLSLKNYPFYLKEYVIKKGVRLAWFNVRKQSLYRKYINKHFDFRNYANEKMDCVVVGSDEVFSLQCGCNMMMFGHGVNTDRLISYAPSFGQTSVDRIDEFHCRALISSGLKQFSAISVRDQNSADVVEHLSGIRPRIVCDPVLLYSFEKVKTKIKEIKRKYILVYSYDRWLTSEEEYRPIQEYAREKGLITVSAGTFHKWCDKNIVCDPLEWVEYFRSAEEVFTDTFHGAVLSIITQKKSVYFIRDLNTNKLSSLFQMFNLEERVIRTISVDEINRVQSDELDISNIQRKLQSVRDESNKWLENALIDCGQEND